MSLDISVLFPRALHKHTCAHHSTGPCCLGCIGLLWGIASLGYPIYTSWVIWPFLASGKGREKSQGGSVPYWQSPQCPGKAAKRRSLVLPHQSLSRAGGHWGEHCLHASTPGHRYWPQPSGRWTAEALKLSGLGQTLHLQPSFWPCELLLRLLHPQPSHILLQVGQLDHAWPLPPWLQALVSLSYDQDEAPGSSNWMLVLNMTSLSFWSIWPCSGLNGLWGTRMEPSCSPFWSSEGPDNFSYIHSLVPLCVLNP